MTEQIDWPALTHRLRTEGLTVRQMADSTGLSKNTINLILAEKYDTAQFDKIVALMVLFRELSDEEFPRLGDHYAGLSKDV